MNKLILLIFTVLLSLGATGQYIGNPPDAYYQRGYVFLKNGSVLKGKYLYSNSMEKLRVISGKNSWVFDASEVDRISNARPKTISEPDSLFDFPDLPSSKWFNLTEIGVLAGNSDNSQSAPLIFGSSFNRQIYKNLSAGAGLGVEFLKETYMPATLNVLYKLRNTRFTPIGMIQAGYLIPLEDSRAVYSEVLPDYLYSSSYYYYYSTTSDLKAKGGFLFNPTLGIMKQSLRGTGMSLSFGYCFQRLHYSGEKDYRLDIDYNRFSVKLGIIIN